MRRALECSRPAYYFHRIVRWA